MKNIKYSLLLLLLPLLVSCFDDKSSDATKPISDIIIESGIDSVYNIEKNDVDVTFRFDKPINGYDIVMHWQPFEYKGCETGTVIVDFYNENGMQFQYINDEKFSTHFIYDIVFD